MTYSQNLNISLKKVSLKHMAVRKSKFLTGCEIIGLNKNFCSTHQEKSYDNIMSNFDSIEKIFKKF